LLSFSNEDGRHDRGDDTRGGGHEDAERWASKPGHAQLARVPSENPTANKIERLISTDTVDWFPQLAPNGHFAVYFQYPATIVGHARRTTAAVRWTRHDQRQQL
jgi:hypothetical protein